MVRCNRRSRGENSTAMNVTRAFVQLQTSRIIRVVWDRRGQDGVEAEDSLQGQDKYQKLSSRKAIASITQSITERFFIGVCFNTAHLH